MEGSFLGRRLKNLPRRADMIRFQQRHELSNSKRARGNVRRTGRIGAATYRS